MSPRRCRRSDPSATRPPRLSCSPPRFSAPRSAPTSTSTNSGEFPLRGLQICSPFNGKCSIAELGGALLSAGADGFFEVLGGEAHVELGVALVVDVGRQAAGVETRPQQPL